jgi:hypothetical protein
LDGDDGRGIVSIAKTNTVGPIDTYTITYDDTTTSTFGVTNGTNGYDGREVELQKSSTHIQWRYVGDTSWTDLVALVDIKGADGIDGIDGVGIVSILKTGTVGLVDTYTITHTDSSTDTFDVTNGTDGLDIAWLGTYDAETIYSINDAVSYLGTSYIWINATPASGHTPADDTYWDILAAKGSGGAGSGDVVGPDGAVSGSIAVFDTESGKLLRDGGMLIDDIPTSLSQLTNDTGFITSSDNKLAYDADDTTPGYISQKIFAGDGISVTEQTDEMENTIAIINTDRGSDVDISGLVPYTGADSDLDLGANGLTVNTITGVTDSTLTINAPVSHSIGGYVNIQGSASGGSGADGGGVRLTTGIAGGDDDREGFIEMVNSDGHAARFDVSGLASATGVTLAIPDKDGTFALTNDIPAVGTAAAEDVGYFATAAQGALADTAIQDISGKENVGVAAGLVADYLPIAGGTMSGKLIAENNTDYTVAQTRNLILSTSDPSGGSNGDIWIKYVL